MSSVKAKFDRVVAKISKGLGGYKKDLDNIITEQRDFLDLLTSLFDAIIDMVKMLIELFDVFIDFSDFVVLFIPASMILFVVSKLTQVI